MDRDLNTAVLDELRLVNQRLDALTATVQRLLPPSRLTAPERRLIVAIGAVFGVGMPITTREILDKCGLPIGERPELQTALVAVAERPDRHAVGIALRRIVDRCGPEDPLRLTAPSMEAGRRVWVIEGIESH